MKCQYCDNEAVRYSYRERNGQVNKERVCEKCHLTKTEDLDKENKVFKRKLTIDETKVLLHDLECLELKKTKDNEYHYNLLRANINDLGWLKNKKKEKL